MWGSVATPSILDVEKAGCVLTKASAEERKSAMPEARVAICIMFGLDIAFARSAKIVRNGIVKYEEEQSCSCAKCKGITFANELRDQFDGT